MQKDDQQRLVDQASSQLHQIGKEAEQLGKRHRRMEYVILAAFFLLMIVALILYALADRYLSRRTPDLSSVSFCVCAFVRFESCVV